MKRAKSTLAMILTIVLCFTAVCPAMGAETAEEGATFNEVALETEPEPSAESYEETDLKEQKSVYDNNDEDAEDTVLEEEVEQEQSDEFLGESDPKKGEETGEPASASASGEDVAQAIWTGGNTTLTFYYGPQVSVGDTFNGVTVGNVWSGTDVTATGDENPKWISSSARFATIVVFDESFSVIKPNSTNGWFYGCYNLEEVNLRGLNTSNVTTMNRMFSECLALTSIDLSSFDTSKVTDMSDMFSECYELTSLDLSSFDTSKVTDMSDMFSRCSKLTSIDLSSFDTSKVTDMSGMFSECFKLTSIDLSSFDTSKVTDMRDMFVYCEVLASLDVSSFDTSNVTNMSYMFVNCSKLKYIYCADNTTNWSAVLNGDDMFNGCSSLVGISSSISIPFDSNNTDSSMAKAAALGGYFTIVGPFSAQAIWTEDNGTLSFYYGPQVSPGEAFNSATVTEAWSGVAVTASESDTPAWYDAAHRDVSKIVFDSSFADVKPISTYAWFADCSNLMSLDISGLDVSAVIDMSRMFENCRKLKYIYCADNTTDWSAVLNGNNMFNGCTSLVGINGSDRVVYDENNTDSSMAKAATLGGYFTLKEDFIAQAIWTETNTTMTFFYGPQIAVGDVFDDALVTRVWSGPDVVYTTFGGSGVGFNPPDWNIQSVTNNLTDVVFDNSFIEVKPTCTHAWFMDCTALKSVDTVGLNTECVTDMSSMFYNCRSLENIDVSQLDMFEVNYTNNMFRNCTSIDYLDFSNTYAGFGACGTKWDYMFSGCTNLKTINLGTFMQPKIEGTIHGVLKTDSMKYMFSSCSNLTTIYCLTDTYNLGTTRISNGMFSGCTSLVGVYGNNQVTYDSANVDGSMAKSASLGGYFTPIGQSGESNGSCGPNLIWTLDDKGTLTISGTGEMYDFDLSSLNAAAPWHKNASEIESIVIEEGGSTIGNNAFNGCVNVTSITVPLSITSIGSNAFTRCENLENIYYVGNAPSIQSDSFTEVVANAYYPVDDLSWNDSVRQDYGGTITWIPWTPEFESSFTPVEAISITGAPYYFRSGLKNDESIKYTFDYNDNWLFSENNADRYDLMQTSIRVAMAAFGTKEDRDYGEKNIKKMMSQMGFKYTNKSIDYPNPDTDTIGSAIGLKNIKNADGSSKSIILIALRGGGYGKEWAGDFRMGPDEDRFENSMYHQGFRMAADDVEQLLDEFLDENKQYISDDLRIWITGFSRAAATSNLVAADLINGAFAGDGIEPEEVLAFCFECPQNIIDSNAHDQKYSKIINVVNPIDFVPKVPFRNWKFTRYGTTYYIPSKETTKSYDKNYKYQMIWKYLDLCDYNDITLTEDRVGEVPGQASALDGFLDHISFWISRGTYYELHEETFMDLTGSLLGGGGTPDWGAAIPTMINVLGVSIYIPLRTGMVIGMFKNTNTGPGPSAHFPELCLSWIDSLEGYSRYKTSEDSIYRRIFINCPVDAVVRDSEGTVVGRIENDEAVEIEDGIVSRIDEDGQKVFILPQDEEYTIEITATDDGEVNYTVEEYNFDTSEAEKVINYKHIDVTAGECLTGTASELPENEEAEYTLQKEDDDEALIPDEVLSGDEVVKYAVDVSYEGEGNVTGGGPYINGEFAKVTAEPAEGFVFTGWYIGDSCVSTETEYRFAVTEDVQLVAKFTQDVSIQLDKSEMTVKTGREYKLTATVSPDNGQQISWESSDPAVAKVDQDGIVTGLKSGTATVTANVEDSGISASCEVTVIGGSWKKDNTGWWYLWEDGSYPKSEFLVIEGVTYYFNPSGYMVTGWRIIDGKWYYFNASGAMMTGWQKLGGVWYYMNSNGAMVTGWQSIGGVWYYFNNSGAMQTGWRQLGGVWYYMNASGAMVTGWQSIGGKWYYFNASGAMMTGWQQIGDVWYYMNSSGAMVTGWLKLGNTWYYMNASGAMVTGRQQIDGTWYTFSSSGAMQ